MALDDKSSLLFKLVDHAFSNTNSPESVRSTAVSQSFSYVVKLLSSNFVSAVADEQSIVQAARQDLELRGQTQQAAKLLDYHQRLVTNAVLDTKVRWGLLRLLGLVAQDVNKPGGGNPTLLAGLTQIGDTSGLPVIHPHQHQLGRQQQHPLSLRQQQYTVSYPSSMDGSLSAGPSIADMDPNASIGRPPSRAASVKTSGPSTPSTWEEGGVFTIKEPVLVRDVLYACQGINGRFTQYLEGGSYSGSTAIGGLAQGGSPEDCAGFVVSSQADLPAVERTLVHRLTELGWLFKRVREHVSSSHDSAGAVRQALCAQLSTELDSFYRLMAVLESQSLQPIPTSGGSDSGGPYLTLRRLSVWLAEPIRRMRLLARLADATAGLSGGALAGAVYGHTQHGDPFVHSYMGKLLDASCVPLFDMMRTWVFEGQLMDPYREFFVASANKGGLAHDMWRDGYWLDQNQLPPFLTQTLANKILRAGKSINFLQECCGDVKWVQDRAAAAQSVSGSTISFGNVEALERFVQDASSEVDQHLIDVMFKKFHLAKQCDAIRRYLLLGQGDFVQALMDLVQKELEQEASNVSEISLNHLVRTAIASSNAKYDEDDILDRIRAKKEKAHGGAESGWDVFTLQYDIRGPLATLFTAKEMARYLRVFQLLWRLKRVEHALAQCWTLLKCEIERTLAKFKENGAAALEVERCCLRLRSEMSHFCTNLQYYIMFEVMEAAWQEFNKRAAAAGDLDELINAHTHYLDTILRKSLLDEQSEGLRKTLGELFSNMLGLLGTVRRFNELVQTAQRKTLSHKKRIDGRTRRGQWGTVSGEEAQAVIPVEDLAAIIRRVEELDKAHQRAMNNFTGQLPTQAHDEVRFLLYRLDYTEFYKRRATVDGEGDDDDQGDAMEQ